MNEHRIVRGMLLRAASGLPASSPLAIAALEWAQQHAAWLLPGQTSAEQALTWDALLAGLRGPEPASAPVQVLVLADALAEQLGLAAMEAVLLQLMVACDQLPRIEALARILDRHGRALPALLGELAGAAPHEAERTVRRSAPVRLGLTGFVTNRQGEVEVEVRWALQRLLDRAPGTGAEMLEALIGQRQPALLDLDGFAHVEHAPFLARLLRGALAERAPGVNILIHGPPGTGKTELARTLDRPLLVKRTSDLLSKWVGETEQQIAEAFGEARRRGALLLFDEVDSLLFDRRDARASWEVTQVNELPTWLDRHPLPVVAATNHPDRLDPATLRRFVFKLRLEPLGPERAARAFARFFGAAAPSDLARLTNLTPGDFSVVARQLRHAPARDAADLVERLAMEAEAKPGTLARIGF